VEEEEEEPELHFRGVIGEEKRAAEFLILIGNWERGSFARRRPAISSLHGGEGGRERNRIVLATCAAGKSLFGWLRGLFGKEGGGRDKKGLARILRLAAAKKGRRAMAYDAAGEGGREKEIGLWRSSSAGEEGSGFRGGLFFRRREGGKEKTRVPSSLPSRKKKVSASLSVGPGGKEGGGINGNSVSPRRDISTLITA